MSYSYGTASARNLPAVSVESEAIRTRNQVIRDVEAVTHQIRLEREKLKSATTRLGKTRTEKERAQARLAEERAKVNEVKALIRDAERETKNALGAAQREATLILATAERECALIRETAHQQARALHDGAWLTGFKRGRNETIAKTSVLNKQKKVNA